jgi:SNF2 family DNA or RNA helicase
VSSNTYKFKTKPYAHQIKGVRFVFGQWNQGLGAALLFDPRTGKTKTAIDSICALHLKHGVRRVLVICPNRVIGTWVQEFHTHSPLHVQCIVWDVKGRKRALPNTVSPYDIQVVLVNFEAFATPGKRLPSGRRSRSTGRFAVRKKIRAWVGDHDAAAIVDEGHKIKSPSGKASTAIVSMRDLFDYRLLLTGTPVTKAHRAHDVFMQWQWVNPRRFSKWGPDAETFRNHVAVWRQNNGFLQFVRSKSRGLEDVRKGLHMDGMAVRREDCFDLPERMPDRIIPISLSPRTRKAYDDMAETMIAEIEEGLIAEASIPIVCMLRLQQITGGFVGITDYDSYNASTVTRNKPARTHRIGKEKLVALKELLIDEYLDRDSDEKLVVAAKYIRDLDDITRLASKLEIPLYRIRGGMTRSDGDEQRIRFQKHRGMAMMLCQPDSASLGIDLSSAAQMVWYSLTSSWVNWTQFCDRIALSQRATTFTYLQVPGSVDELMYRGLINDTDVARYIMKKPARLRLKK